MTRLTIFDKLGITKTMELIIKDVLNGLSAWCMFLVCSINLRLSQPFINKTFITKDKGM